MKSEPPVRSTTPAERMHELIVTGDIGVEKYEIASNGDPCITVIETIQHLAREELGREVVIQLVDNPWNETLVKDFTVDTTSAHDRLGWQPERTVKRSIHDLIRTKG